MNPGFIDKIAVDCDNVLADTVPAFLKFQNNEYGTDIKMGDIKQYDISGLIGCEPHEVPERFGEFFSSHYANEIQPVEGSVEAVMALSKNRELSIITARSVELMELTIEFIDRHYQNKFSSIYSASSYELDGKDKKKSEICIDIKAKAIIDDSLHTAKDCSENGIMSLLYDYPWNRAEHDNGVVRVKSWEEVLECL